MKLAIYPVEAIENALVILSDEKSWTKGAFARNRKGVSVDAYSDKAVCFCMLGALEHGVRGGENASARDYYGSLHYGAQWKAQNFIRTALEGRTIQSFNDSKYTTHAEVIEVLNKALDLARAAA